MEGVGGNIYQLHLEIPMRRPLRARPEICKIVIVYYMSLLNQTSVNHAEVKA